MVRTTYLLLLLGVSAPSLHPQDFKSVQIHGYATQGVLYSSHNNYLENKTSDGDFGWSDAVVSVAAKPFNKLRVGVQFHYLRLGSLGDDKPAVDWALADYKFNDYFGIRVGKVKTPLGLFNDSQDIDPVFLWSLLPQSTYQIDNRSYYLAHLGGELYGSAHLGEKGGKLSYRAYGGHNTLAANGGYVAQLTGLTGLQLSKAPSGPVYGADLRWQTPCKPLLLGASIYVQSITGIAPGGGISFHAAIPAYYAQLDHRKFYFAGEFRRQPVTGTIQLGPYTFPYVDHQQQWYIMSSYHLSSKLQAGAYYSHLIDTDLPPRQQASSSKDLVFSARYDFNSNFYAKAENHSLHGTVLGFYQADNPQGLTSRSDVVVAKLGFYF